MGELQIAEDDVADAISADRQIAVGLDVLSEFANDGQRYR